MHKQNTSNIEKWWEKKNINKHFLLQLKCVQTIRSKLHLKGCIFGIICVLKVRYVCFSPHGPFSPGCFSQMDLKWMEELLKHINFHDSNFCIAVIAIIFNPLFWNVVRLTADNTSDIVATK